VKHEIEVCLWTVVRAVDSEFGVTRGTKCLERIITCPYDDFPLVISDIPSFPDFYNALCKSMLKVRHESKGQGEGIILLPIVSGILHQFINIDLKGEDVIISDVWDTIEQDAAKLTTLAELCLIYGEYDYAQDCLGAIMDGGSKNLSGVHSKLRGFMPEVPPLPTR